MPTGGAPFRDGLTMPFIHSRARTPGRTSRALGPCRHGLISSSLACAALAAHAEAQEDWNVHAQLTYVSQRKDAVASPYSGLNSLRAGPESSYSLTATAALGLRLGPSTELYVNPEVAQGKPISGLLGLAGFSNGELAKTSGTNPKLYRARLFARHTVDLGGDTVDLPSGANQLAGRTTSDRLVLTAGALSVLDIFDTNSLAHDPRMQFMNWALMTHAAYDYPADSRGYTYGVAAEFITDAWALRAGRFSVPLQPNQLQLDSHLLRHYGDQVELSRDYSIADQAGTARLLVYRVKAAMADYADALAASTGEPSLDVPARRVRSKSGAGVSIEHRVSSQVALFLRALQADGKTETYAFTEADRSFSIGAQWDMSGWGRPHDSTGFGWALNGLSAAHREFLRRGGTTFFLGDGTLRYRGEQDLEWYYRSELSKGFYLTADVQQVHSPGYNADRGPARFYALRLHWEQ